LEVLRGKHQPLLMPSEALQLSSRCHLSLSSASVDYINGKLVFNSVCNFFVSVMFMNLI
jgi:hypothetical protein